MGAIDYRVNPGARESFYAAIRRYWPGLPDGCLQPDYSGVRPKLSRQGEPAPDFAIDGPERAWRAGAGEPVRHRVAGPDRGAGDRRVACRARWTGSERDGRKSIEGIGVAVGCYLQHLPTLLSFYTRPVPRLPQHHVRTGRASSLAHQRIRRPPSVSRGRVAQPSCSARPCWRRPCRPNCGCWTGDAPAPMRSRSWPPACGCASRR